MSIFATILIDSKASHYISVIKATKFLSTINPSKNHDRIGTKENIAEFKLIRNNRFIFTPTTIAPYFLT